MIDKVARLFAKVIGQPALMKQLTRVGLHSRTLMEWMLRIMANLLRPDELGPAEAAYKAVGRALKTALRVESSGIPSTKGTL